MTALKDTTVRTGTKENVELECSVLMVPLFLPSVRVAFTSLLSLPLLRMTAFNAFQDKLVFRNSSSLEMTYMSVRKLRTLPLSPLPLISHL